MQTKRSASAYKEKRKVPRLDIEYVTVEIYTSDEYPSSTDILEIGSILNISEHGLLFSAERPYNAGQLLRLTFALPDSMVIIRSDVHVIHMQKDKSYKIGVEFVNLSPADHKFIKHFVMKKLVVQKT